MKSLIDLIWNDEVEDDDLDEMVNAFMTNTCIAPNCGGSGHDPSMVNAQFCSIRNP